MVAAYLWSEQGVSRDWPPVTPICVLALVEAHRRGVRLRGRGVGRFRSAANPEGKTASGAAAATIESSNRAADRMCRISRAGGAAGSVVAIVIGPAEGFLQRVAKEQQ